MKKTILMISFSAMANLPIHGMYDKIHRRLSQSVGKNEKQKNANKKIKFKGSCPFTDCFYSMTSNMKEELRASLIRHLKAKHKDNWCPHFGCIEHSETNVNIEEHIIDHNSCITDNA